MRRVVVGLGSLSGGDDAVGLAVIAALEGSDLDADLVSLRDASGLIDLLAAGGQVVLVDAVVGLGAPGLVAVLDEDALDGEAKAVSTHTLSVPAAVSLARTLHGQIARLQLVGVAIEPCVGPQTGLSPAVAAAVPVAVEAVRALLFDPEQTHA